MLPVVLISAASLLLLSITNRLGRIVDRARSLASELENPSSPPQEASRAQLPILLKRARVIRLSVTFASLSILFASLMIFSLSLFLFAGWPIKIPILTLFLFNTLSLIACLIYFLMDVSMALKALTLDIELHLRR